MDTPGRHRDEVPGPLHAGGLEGLGRKRGDGARHVLHGLFALPDGHDDFGDFLLLCHDGGHGCREPDERGQHEARAGGNVGELSKDNERR